MRRLSLAMMSLAIASLVTMVSCEKPNIERIVPGTQHTITFNATTESNGGSKTTLNGIEVWWSSGDQLSVNNNGQLTLTDGVGSMYGTFTGYVTLDPSYLVGYPVEAPNDGTSITFTIHDEQNDNGESLSGKIPMAAYTTNGNATLAFKNMVNVLKLNLTGKEDISSIEVKSPGENLNGSFTVGTDLKPSVINGEVTTDSEKITVEKSMTLSTTPQTVYVILPVLNSAEGTVTVKFSNDGGSKTQTVAMNLNHSNTPNHMYDADIDVLLKTSKTGPTDVETTADCSSELVYTMGGSFKLSTAQVVEYGFVCLEGESGVPTIGAANCFRVVGGTANMPVGTTEFTVDITGLEAGHTYRVRAYAMGENGTPAYAANSSDGIRTIRGGNVVQPLPSSWTNGTSPYEFTVAEGRTVKFSQGNLRYYCSTSTPKWRFAEHQFDMCDRNTSEHNTEDYGENTGKWIDLFGWGTSGWPNNNYYYYPYNTENYVDNPPGSHIAFDPKGFGYGPTDGTNYHISLTGYYAYADWGVYNAIENGGNSSGMWRTLTKDEWVFLLNTRTNASSKWGLGKVGYCIPGLIILPDVWELPTGLSFASGKTDFVNKYTYSDWSQMEAAGAVFLPCAGRRWGVQVGFVGTNGDYWSSSSSTGKPEQNEPAKEIIQGGAYGLDFVSKNIYPNHTRRRYDGRSVRLVRE